MARKKNYRQIDKRTESTILFTGGIPLGELFTEDELSDFLALARRRIIRTFDVATEPNPRFRRGCGKPRRNTDNYIVGVGGRPSDLTRRVSKQLTHPIVKESDLPYFLSGISPKLIDRQLQQASQQIIQHCVVAMRDNGDIYFEESRGTWEIAQSCIDEYKSERSVARNSMKVDWRTYHGRNRAQSNRRNIPEGVSIGGSIAV